MEAIVAGDAEIGITLNAPRRAEVSVCWSWQEALHAIVAPGHPLSDRTSISLEELAAYPAALPDRTFGVRRQIDAMLEQTDLRPRILVVTNSILTTVCVARQGVAYTLMPMFVVERDIESGTLRAIPLGDGGLILSRVEICIHRNRRLSNAAREFLSWLEQNTPKHDPSKSLEAARSSPKRGSDRHGGRRRVS
jgi:DNA-binding transcriptional LysR family regulator